MVTNMIEPEVVIDEIQFDTGEAVLSITVGSDSIQSSNFGDNSFLVENTGQKNIAKVEIDVTNALYPDSVFDPFGLAGDSTAKPLTINTAGGTGVVAPSSASYIGAGGTAGYGGIQLLFDEATDGGFNPGETVGFAIDMDPNSVAGTSKGPLDGGSDPGWDVGGVSGAELIGSTFTVTFTDGTTATGQLQGANNQAGSQGVASQSSPNQTVSLSVNGLSEGGIGTYGPNGPSVVISGPAGQTARVVLTKGFIQPVTPYNQALADQLAALAATDFPANNAVEFQTVDIALTGADQDISGLFNFAEVALYDFLGEDQLPIGFTASVIDPANDGLPLGPVTKPIYLKFSETGSASPVITTSPNVTVLENQTSVLDIQATDADGDTEGNGLSYSLTGGADQALFALDSATGVLSFLNAPDFESPLDSDENNVYQLEVAVTDSDLLSTTQILNVVVNDVVEGPTDPPIVEGPPDPVVEGPTDPSNPGTSDDLQQVGPSLLQAQSDGQLKVGELTSAKGTLNEIGLFVVDDANGTVDGVAPGEAGYLTTVLENAQVVLSTLKGKVDFNGLEQLRDIAAQNGQLLSFFVSRDRTLDELRAGGDSGQVLFAQSAANANGFQALQIEEIGGGEFRYRWRTEDGAFDALSFDVDFGGGEVPFGAASQGGPTSEFFDLFGKETVSAQFNVFREAVNDNLLGFYKIEDAAGRVLNAADELIAPGEAGYREALLASWQSLNISLTGQNSVMQTYTFELAGDMLLAPFLLVNGAGQTPSLDLTNDLYTSFMGANPNGVDHVRLLGSNTFGFEDLRNGGDRDFNDIIIQATFS
ncbi:hypothetical protein C7271_17000 [filamentous cyanobacterium CCP5]|nr:hypothetical protein C7271_17000 [filamentous cyanobacterium CCP5]